jgi:methylthioribose-1-phosphate isomerase
MVVRGAPLIGATAAYGMALAHRRPIRPTANAGAAAYDASLMRIAADRGQPALGTR